MGEDEESVSFSSLLPTISPDFPGLFITEHQRSGFETAGGISMNNLSCEPDN
jgi:hypothetical protein